MDNVIQGLTQSPLIQNMSDVENNVKRFTNDIPDNAPYRSFNKAEVEAYTGDKNDPNSTLRFKVPRSGFLNRMYLKVRLHLTNAPDALFVYPDPNDFKKARGGDFFANFFTAASLEIGGRSVQTLQAEDIIFDAASAKGGVGERMMYDMKGHFGEVDETLGDAFSFGMQSAPAAVQSPHYAHFLIPLPFSIFNFHKDSIDTTFLPNVELVFDKRAMLGFQVAGDYTRASLVCMYHNVHPHFKTQIRNRNYERGSTTQLSVDSQVVTSAPKIENVAEIPSDHGAVPPVLGTDEFQRYTYDIKSDVFASDFLITFRRDAVFQLNEFSGEMASVPGRDDFMRFILKANGKILLDKYAHEITNQFSNTSAMAIPDSIDMIHVRKVFESDFDTDVRFIAGSTAMSGDLPWPRMGKRKSPIYRIPLSLFGTDEFLNGGLNLAALTNVQIIIESPAMLPLGIESEYKDVTPRIVIRHKTVTRIDGKTGVVSV